MWHVVSNFETLHLQMSIQYVFSLYNHVYVCDWIHNVLIIMLVFVENRKMVSLLFPFLWIIIKNYRVTSVIKRLKIQLNF